MWSARLSRREVLELFLNAGRPAVASLQQTAGVTFEGDASVFHAFWEYEVAANFPQPNLIVVPDGSEGELLVALNASPHAPSPITSLTRVLTRSEARRLFVSSNLESADAALPLAVALAMAEAVVLSEGRVSLRLVTPALCKRTLSYAWGKALAAQVPAEFLEMLPERWAESYGIVNGSNAPPWIRGTVAAMVSPLAASAQLGLGVQPSSAAGKLAYATLLRDRSLQQKIWNQLVQSAGGAPSLESIASATREERGVYLQQMLKASAQRNADEASAATCAFLATQVAPGSLEHFELLRAGTHPSVVFWYALFACAQTPTEILNGLGGLGMRVLRDISAIEVPLGRPLADLAFSELKALERVGIETLGRKFGHLGEVEVELIPLVTSSFSVHSRSSKTRNEPAQQLSLEPESRPGRLDPTINAKLRDVISNLSELLLQLPESEPGEASSSKRYLPQSKRPKSSRGGE